jgi:hypothetical protein
MPCPRNAAHRVQRRRASRACVRLFQLFPFSCIRLVSFKTSHLSIETFSSVPARSPAASLGEGSLARKPWIVYQRGSADEHGGPEAQYPRIRAGRVAAFGRPAGERVLLQGLEARSRHSGVCSPAKDTIATPRPRRRKRSHGGTQDVRKHRSCRPRGASGRRRGCRRTSCTRCCTRCRRSGRVRPRTRHRISSSGSSSSRR